MGSSGAPGFPPPVLIVYSGPWFLRLLKGGWASTAGGEAAAGGGVALACLSCAWCCWYCCRVRPPPPAPAVLVGAG